MNSPLARATCLIHAARPASARCPDCGAFFCDECITEHEGRLTCARCLAAHRSPASDLTPARRRFRPPIMAPLQFAAGLLILWLFYLIIARALLSIPAELHDGAVWK